jgi:quinol-cytochrome oxidoreductase complex cytochrome b subunit
MKDLQFVVFLGPFLRAMHRWAAHGMVICVFLHMCRVFYTGSYKKPRQFNWVIGVFLLLLTLGLSFTGYLLPWDQLSYWAITVGTNIGSYAPLIGGQLREILLGGHSVGEAALLRFYVLHVAVLPSLIILLTIVHFWRVRKDGGLSRPLWNLKPAKQPEVLVTIGAPPVTAHLKTGPASQEKTYGLMEVVTGKPIFETILPDEEEDTVFSYPYAFVREAVALMATVTTIMTISLFFHAPLEELANPAKTPNPAKAPWYFLGLQELVSHSAFLGGVVAPAVMVLALLAIPYLDRNPSRRLADRKWILGIFTFFVAVNVILIIVGTFFRGPGWALVPPWVHVVGGAE